MRAAVSFHMFGAILKVTSIHRMICFTFDMVMRNQMASTQRTLGLCYDLLVRTQSTLNQYCYAVDVVLATNLITCGKHQ